MDIRRALLMMPHGLDTSPVIIAYDTRYINNGNTEAKSGASITKIYDLLKVTQVSTDRQFIIYGVVPTTLNYKDDVFKDYWNHTAIESEAQRTLAPYGINQMAFTLQTDMIDDCYAIHVSTGQILFAGKNSIYYGHRNIAELN